MSRPSSVSHIEPGLVVLHSNRMEVLRDSLVKWLYTYPLDPLETDIIAVQSNGIAQWLRAALATEAPDGQPGIAAALDTPMPSRLMWSLYRRVLGQASVPEFSALDEQPLVWRLMRLLGTLPHRACYQPLHRFLEDDADLRKRHQLALKLADLFDQYQVYRADWLADWAEGHDTLRAAGGARELDADQQWQPALWRDILSDVGPQGSHAGRAAVHARFLHALREWPAAGASPDLPRRIVVFGVSALPRQTLEALVEIGRWTQVLVCVHNPCEYHWADIVEGRALLRQVRRHQRGRPDRPVEIDADQLHAHAHPLLASWGRQGRDYIALLEELDDECGRRLDSERDAHVDSGIRFNVAPAFARVESGTMLGRLLDDIRGLRSLPEIREEGRTLAADDSSICFHVAHSALREVEILHDQLLAAFDADTTLQPDDVIVMVPDIEQYAPYIEAVFGLHGANDARKLPYFIVDRGPASVNTVAEAVEKLLSMPQSRLGVGEVLDLLDIAAIRARFDLHETDIAVLRDWIHGANIRWGLDGAHRETLGLPLVPSLADLHTWAFGLERMLLGYATGDTDEWNGIAPYGDVAGLEARLVGTLAHVLERMNHYSQVLAQPARPAEWVRRLRGLLDDFLKAPGDVAEYTIEQLGTALDDWLSNCEATGFDEAVTLSVVSNHWLACLKTAGMAQRFTNGSITFATLMPMRAIPFRHVCLMGMSDGDYPRSRTPAHFDLMEKDYRPGDRSRRDDDRYLFLEALLSARDRFYVSWVGRSIVDNTERPPSVLVAQLRDHLAGAWQPAEGNDDLLGQITTVHPLQAFSPQYFGEAQGKPKLFTYAKEWRADTGVVDESAATQLDVPPPGAAPGLDAFVRHEPLSFHELQRFVEHPVREFFRQRLQVWVDENETVDDEELFVADGLNNWQVYNGLIQAAQVSLEEGGDAVVACDAALERMMNRGELAFGGAGQLQVLQCREQAVRMLDAYQNSVKEWPLIVDYSVDVHHACEGTPGVAGALDGLRHDNDNRFLRLGLQASRLTNSRKQWREDKLVEHWIRHLAGNSTGLTMTSIAISPAGIARFDPVDPDEAAAMLDTLLRAWAQGMCRPLPVKAEFARPVLTALPGATVPTPGTTEWREWLDSDKLNKQLRTCHKEYWNQSGRSEAPYERRAYPTLESLLAGGELVQWAVELYEPMFRATRKEAE